MKHEEIFHTCDRCGKRIDKVPTDTRSLQRLWRKNFSPTEYKLLTSERYGYINKADLISENVISVQVCEEYNIKEKKFDLCGDCRKAFERFMRNDKD